MSNSINFKNHPFRFLLYLEWILLGFAALTAFLPSHRFANQYPGLTICSLIMFGLMGLTIPTTNKINKVLYTAVEIVLIIFIGFSGGKTARLFPFINVILVTRGCLSFQQSGRLVVTILSFGLFLFTLIWRFSRFPLTPSAQERFHFLSLSLALLFGLSLVFVLLLMNAIISERKSSEKLAIANQKLREYALKIENQATLEERNRIAREIHDALGHSLTALNLQLETALKLWESHPQRAKTFLATAKELGSRALQEVRQSVSTMRSNPLQQQSLEEAIAILAEDFHRATGIAINCQINLSAVPHEISVVIYRILQESLTNISKYARATIVSLELYQTSKSLNLSISDNGKGFNLAQTTTGFGLQSMRDRTMAVGGNFKVTSANGAGCQIKVNIPTPHITND